MVNKLSTESSANQRDNERVATMVTVELGTELWPRKGVTRDISASGMFIETDAIHPIEHSITFNVELDTPQGKLPHKCRGEVVRIEPHGPKVGVAVKITESTIAMGSITLLPAATENATAVQTHDE